MYLHVTYVRMSQLAGLFTDLSVAAQIPTWFKKRKSFAKTCSPTSRSSTRNSRAAHRVITVALVVTAVIDTAAIQGPTRAMVATILLQQEQETLHHHPLVLAVPLRQLITANMPNTTQTLEPVLMDRILTLRMVAMLGRNSEANYIETTS